MRFSRICKVVSSHTSIQVTSVAEHEDVASHTTALLKKGTKSESKIEVFGNAKWGNSIQKDFQRLLKI